MSQNGPYHGQGWPPGGAAGPGEPYAEPADPWGEAASPHGPDPSWDPVPPESSWDNRSMPVPPDPSAGYGGPGADLTGYPPLPGYAAAPLNAPPPWHQPPAPPPRRRNAPIVALVVVLGLLICGGLGTTAFLMSRSETIDPAEGRSVATASGSPTRDGAVPEPQTSQDARFVGRGQCVRNEGDAEESPELKIVTCTSGTYEVLKRVDGRTTGEQDAEGKCSKVPDYTKWYFYDSELDSLDFVLCLRDYGTD